MVYRATESGVYGYAVAASHFTAGSRRECAVSATATLTTARSTTNTAPVTSGMEMTFFFEGAAPAGDVPRSASRREATPAESTFVVVGMSGTFSARRLERTIAAGRRRARPRARGC